MARPPITLNTPYRIRTERLLLRCWDPLDAPGLLEAIAESRAELLPWMPWASAEPVALAEKVACMRRWRGEFDLDRDYHMGIFEPGEERVLGGCSLHRCPGPAALEVGYWVRSGHAGRGLATEAAAALVRVAFEVHAAVRVDLRCDPENRASAAIAGKLGFTSEGLLRRRFPLGSGDLRDTLLFCLHQDELAGSPAARAPIELFDVVGDPIRL